MGIFVSELTEQGRGGKGNESSAVRQLTLKLMCAWRAAGRRVRNSFDPHFTNDSGKEICFRTHKGEVTGPGLER